MANLISKDSPLDSDLHVGDITRTIYVKGEQVIEYSLLALILRAIPPGAKHQGGISEGCISASRKTLDLHEQCINALWTRTNDPVLRARYINW